MRIYKCNLIIAVVTGWIAILFSLIIIYLEIAQSLMFGYGREQWFVMLSAMILFAGAISFLYIVDVAHQKEELVKKLNQKLNNRGWNEGNSNKSSKK